VEQTLKNCQKKNHGATWEQGKTGSAVSQKSGVLKVKVSMMGGWGGLHYGENYRHLLDNRTKARNEGGTGLKSGTLKTWVVLMGGAEESRNASRPAKKKHQGKTKKQRGVGGVKVNWWNRKGGGVHPKKKMGNGSHERGSSNELSWKDCSEGKGCGGEHMKWDCQGRGGRGKRTWLGTKRTTTNLSIEENREGGKLHRRFIKHERG